MFVQKLSISSIITACYLRAGSSTNVGSTTCAPPLVPPPASQRWCNDVNATVVLPPVPRRCVVSGPPTHARWLSAGVGSTAVPPPLVAPPASQRWRNDVCPTGGLPPARHRCVHGRVATVGAATVAPPANHCRLASATTALPPSRHHCLVNWGITQHPVNMVDKAATSIHRPNVVLPALSHPMASTP